MKDSALRLNILIVTPAKPGSTMGNRITAMRWARLLRDLGHRVTIANDFDGKPRDLMLALHAVKSGDAIHAFRGAFLGRPVGVLLTGTDLYVDAAAGAPILGTLEIADALVVLQPQTINDLPEHLRAKAREIYQSIEPLPNSRSGSKRGGFEICVLAHLRAVKDPLRAALATRLLPEGSKIEVYGAGLVLDEELGSSAKQEEKANRRFHWLGALSHRRTLALLARCKALVVSSLSEGGPNVISEAVVAGKPVLATRVSGNIGLLGKSYEGYFEPGDTAGLAKLLLRCETDGKFYGRLCQQVAKLIPLFEPQRERQALAQLVSDLTSSTEPG